MEKRTTTTTTLKNKIINLFKSSPCNHTSKALPDSVQEPVFVSSHRHDAVDLRHSLSLPSFSDQPLSGSCPPALKKKKKKEERRVSENDLFYGAGGRNKDGKMCPPGSPVSELNHWFKHQQKTNKRRKKKKKLLSNPYGFTTSSSSEEEDDYDNDDGNELFSSDEREEETETLFSSRSFSSDSSGFYYNSYRSGRKNVSRGRRPPRRGGSRRHYWTNDGFRPLVSVSSRMEANVKGMEMKKEKDYEKNEERGDDGFPVVKESDDPYADFRISMLEMIVEKQMFGKEELEGLLHCYLSLNAPHHHSIIHKVFSDICEVLFCN